MKTKKQIKKLQDKVYWLNLHLKDLRKKDLDKIKQQRIRRDITQKILSAFIFLLFTAFALSYLYEVIYK